MTPTIIAPSILSANFARLQQEMEDARDGGTTFFHLDVMDGHFVPNLTFGPPIVKCLKPGFTGDEIFDCHLMVNNPESLINAFADALIQSEGEQGRHFLSVHVEVCPHVHRAIESIRRAGLRPGVVLNPGTPLSTLDEVLPLVDLVLLMSVDPGFGGQAFIPSVLRKIYRLRQRIVEEHLACHIEVDGGLKVHNIREIAAAGADILVAGSEVFGKRSQGSTPADQVRKLRDAVAGVDPGTPILPGSPA